MSGDVISALNPFNMIGRVAKAFTPDAPKMPELPKGPSLDPATVEATAQTARDQRRRISASSTLINPGGLGQVSKDSLVRRTLLGS